MRILYNLLILLLTPIFLLRLLIKSRKNPDYRKNILERFAYKLPETPKNLLWFHTVSVGEFHALRSSLTELIKKFHIQILLTCMTPTGRKQIELFKNQFPENVFYSYLPYDTSFSINRFLKKIQPKAAIFMETELWPNALFQSQKNNIPTLLINARLSKKSFNGYQKFGKALFMPLLRKLIVNAQTSDDADRLIKLGVNAANVTITPNMKYILDNAATQKLDNFFTENVNQWLFIAASTHAPEEKWIIESYKELLELNKNARLCIAPRHPERREEIIALINTAGYRAKLRSKSECIENANDILLLDTLGELSRAYLSAAVAFIGGSLINHGGQNPLQPLQAGCSICFGSYMYNFQAISKALQQFEYVSQIDKESLSICVLHLYQARTAESRNHIQETQRKYSQDVLNKQLNYLIKYIDK